MSNTYDIVCKECKVKLWFGQQSRSVGLMIHNYRDDEGTHLLARFFLDHLGHDMVVEDEHSPNPIDATYLEVEPWSSA
jgi:hypothetical protein